MLTNLRVKNFALFDEVEIDFAPGLNIIIGETGAGKSILIDALMLTLGERATQDQIKFGTSKAYVEASYDISDYIDIRELLEDFIDETNYLIIRREITNKGISRAFINDTPCSLSLLKELGNYLVDFHGQHTHQQLLTSKFQLSVLDSLAGNSDLLSKLKSLINRLNEAFEKLEKLLNDRRQFIENKEEIEFALKEIVKINPQPNEIYEIENELKLLENAEIIVSNLNEAFNLLYNSSFSVYDQLINAIKHLERVINFDNKISLLQSELNGASNVIKEVSQEISSKIQSLEFNPERVQKLRERLLELKYLEKKYLGYENIFVEKERMLSELAKDLKFDVEIKSLTNEIDKVRKEVSSIALEIHNRRLDAKKLLEEKVPIILNQLGIIDVKFRVEITQDEVKSDEERLFAEISNKRYKLYSNGIDKVEFLISTNPSVPLQPLSFVASGGELSRIMLAIKSIAAEHYHFPTLIFDEIDVGISGKVAQLAGRIMKNIAEKHQIIVITHLPQIAAAGENIILVEKKVADNQTDISVRTLNKKEKVFEIAKLLSGETITESAIENAKHIINEFNHASDELI